MNFNHMHIAQLNIGQLVADVDDMQVAEFIENLGRINALAKRMEGFIWMKEDAENPERGNIDAPITQNPREVANLSVWRDVASLENFVFGTLHKHFYERRSAWFLTPKAPHFVMWFIDQGAEPTMDEAMERLAQLRRDGEGSEAFGWSYARAHYGIAPRRCTDMQELELQ